MSPVENSMNDEMIWRSPAERMKAREFSESLACEFPEGAPEAGDSSTRRDFLKMMGASLALAGATGCRWPQETIVPYTRRPQGHVPGSTKQFATAMELGGFAAGLLATSYDGRPIKIEGNPSHPIDLGAADSLSQASVLELYDPDRMRTLVRRNAQISQTRTWDDFNTFVFKYFSEDKNRKGAGVHILCEASSSIGLFDMRRRFLQAMPQACWHEYEPLTRDEIVVGAQLAFGKPFRTHFDFQNADVVLALDADFLGADPASLLYAREFINRRNPDSIMNRLYAVESVYSITGAMADHRLPLQTGQIETFAYAVAAAVLFHRDFSLPDEYAQTIEPLKNHIEHDFPEAFIEALADDLIANSGRSLIVVGPRQPASLHALVHMLNAILGNVGHTVRYTDDPEAVRPPYVDAIRSLVKKMQGGTVKTLLIIGGNPAFDAPSDLAFAQFLANVPLSIHLSLFENETSRLCSWQLPRAHFLEAWGDARAYDGTLCTIQPLIEPLYGGMTPIELLSIIIDEEPLSGYDIMRRTMEPLAVDGDFETFWKSTLHEGFVAGSDYRDQRPSLQLQVIQSLISEFRIPDPAYREDLEIVFCQDTSIYDGRFANNGWLQELPDFMTQLTWDNAALFSPATAQDLGIEHEEVVVLDYAGRQIEVPAYVMPGQASYSVSVNLGYGRTAAGRVGDGIGVDLYPLRSSGAMHFDYGLMVQGTERKYNSLVRKTISPSIRRG